MRGIIPCLFAQLPARDNAAGPLEGTASPADDYSGVSNHSQIVGRHRCWLLTAYPSGLSRVSQPRWLLTAYPSGLTRVSQPPDPRLAWGQTPQFRQRSRADDFWPEGLCLTVLSPLDTPILSMIGTGEFRCSGFYEQTLRAGPTTSGIIPCLFLFSQMIQAAPHDCRLPPTAAI
jgi:hypothetical protein